MGNPSTLKYFWEVTQSGMHKNRAPGASTAVTVGLYFNTFTPIHTVFHEDVRMDWFSWLWINGPACLPGRWLTLDQKTKQNNVYNYESSQTLYPNSQTREVWGQGRYTGAQPKGILQNASWDSSDNSPAVPTYFPGNCPSWCFHIPNFLSIKI